LLTLLYYALLVVIIIMNTITPISLAAVAAVEQHAKRLDVVLAELFSDYSRSRLKEWILGGHVSVNGDIIIAPRHKCSVGDNIVVEASLSIQSHDKAQNIALEPVFEDEHIFVINKPAGLVVHPGAGQADGTLLNALLAHCPGIEVVPRAGIVHRLDKDTTGLMVVAKTLVAQNHLVEQLQSRTMSREYEAIVNGTMIAGGFVDAPIGRHATKRTHMAVTTSGKQAVTHYRVIEKFRAHTHLRLKLDTGRTHQIRVHMTHIKHPIVGDPVYGGRSRLPKEAGPLLVESLRGFSRQALHAAQLSLLHPITGEWLTWQAPLPSDMTALLSVLREDTQLFVKDLDD